MQECCALTDFPIRPARRNCRQPNSGQLGNRMRTTISAHNPKSTTFTGIRCERSFTFLPNININDSLCMGTHSAMLWLSGILFLAGTCERALFDAANGTPQRNAKHDATREPQRRKWKMSQSRAHVHPDDVCEFMDVFVMPSSKPHARTAMTDCATPHSSAQHRTETGGRECVGCYELSHKHTPTKERSCSLVQHIAQIVHMIRSGMVFSHAASSKPQTAGNS